MTARSTYKRRSGAVALIALLAALLAALIAPTPSQAEKATPRITPEVTGFLDSHNHVNANEAHGGGLHCGRPFAEGGAAEALVDCLDHNPFGIPALWENITRTGSPLGTHDTRGWPTFKDWPANDSMTHQQTYVDWIERAWRGGLRVMTNDLVANRQLCEIYWIKKNPCGEMDTIRLEAQRSYEMQAYVDKQNGGAGKGWYRIVKSPAEARQVIGDGKLAVVLGIETSEPFGCRQVQGVAQCTREQIDKGLDEVQALGVQSMFLCHKYDNALCGVRFDSGVQGVVVNAANFASTGRFWQAETCTTPDHDNPIEMSNDLTQILSGPLAVLRPVGVTLPVYPKAPHCNVLGMTELGEYTLRAMMKRGMTVELDHMSAKAADRALDIMEEANYNRVVSSHSWTDPLNYPRIQKLGGMVTGIAEQSDAFVAGWRKVKATDPRRPFSFGFGMDANGMHVLPAKRPGSAVTYPFVALDGSPMERLKTGQRTWDVNAEGVANYGLAPDWIEDMRLQAGQEIIDDMARGAEGYLRMWEGRRA
jgi:microsomal dipeptidase-like Zn-dependent dipeptidase